MLDFLRRSRVARLLAVGAVALVTGGAQTSCSAGDPSLLPRPEESGESGNGPTFTTTLVLEDAAGVEKTSFQAGERITLQLTVRNRTPQTVEVDFASGHQYDFFVFTSGSNATHWVWSSTALFTQATSTQTFAAGESKVFSVHWSTDRRGQYEARGALLFDGLLQNPLAPHELGSTLREFTVY